MNSFANLALAEYIRRKAAFDEAVNARGYPRAQAERGLACWLAIGLHAGVPVAELGEIHRHWQAERGLSDSWARHILLWECPPEPEWRAELARARDQAEAKMRANPGDADALRRHLTLDTLAAILRNDPLPLGEVAARSADGEGRGATTPERKAA